MKKVLLAILFIFLFAPIIQKSFGWVSERDLAGSFSTAQDTVFTWKGWMSGSFQQKKEKYLNENFGFRRTLVQLYNEYRYRLFRLSTNVEAVFGKDDVFFAEAYIESYVGKDYIGHESILRLATDIRNVQDSLQKINVTLLPVLAPNKARTYKDYIPESYLPAKMSNYEDIAKTFKEQKVKFIDFNDLFTKTNNTSPYPLFSKYGIHWSVYGHTLAADSIVKYIEKERNIQMPSFIWKDNIELSDSLRGLDYDIGSGMNLLTRQLPSQKMGYPHIRFANKDRKKPSLLVIGDSFHFGIQDTRVPEELFSNYKFIYYMEQQYAPWSDDKDAIKKLDLMNEVRTHEVIIIICTEHNMDTFGWNFIEKVNWFVENTGWR